MSEFNEEEYLLISGIQHFAFCPRQWALIHIEQQWTENYLTASGRILHNKVHDNSQFEKRGEIITARALRISSSRLGVTGECDVVEFRRDNKGVIIKNYSGLYIPYPIEYKRGKSKVNDCDRLQLCAQAICIEDMLGCEIAEGALFYGKPRRREVVLFTKELRFKVEEITETMHSLFKRQLTPKAKVSKHCQSCSLKNQCLPKLLKKKKTVQEYLEEALL